MWYVCWLLESSIAGYTCELASQWFKTGIKLKHMKARIIVESAAVTKPLSVSSPCVPSPHEEQRGWPRSRSVVTATPRAHLAMRDETGCAISDSLRRLSHWGLGVRGYTRTCCWSQRGGSDCSAMLSPANSGQEISVALNFRHFQRERKASFGDEGES